MKKKQINEQRKKMSFRTYPGAFDIHSQDAPFCVRFINRVLKFLIYLIVCCFFPWVKQSIMAKHHLPCHFMKGKLLNSYTYMAYETIVDPLEEGR